ncbi:MAG TPA: CDP-diacylglycerol--glycerol-3-phosphate 3-phosphatidyltransferase [Phycisphaerae bacterium]|nr:CDP-diacylglycerol--glycerol-3-phosphate 3-phosphatidyltransferase [Phycisphaerae bacterium]HRY67461.1 CDP-diacylglycerol--glycerol-3-phosphate 3-phosphatidyltransferase [Phycisphaerae bacterium]HSA27946.1 CDP-diacylglycerol--glycerol-3-phosphate 3-phosphatidyltransferase [Phycisphaerae bacterium]
MRVNLPNQITLGRLVLAIIFFVCLARYDARVVVPASGLLDWCTALFLVAALSDIVDGYLARKWNEVTSFGRVIDPFVDKILVIGGYVFLAGEGFVDPGGRMVSDVSGWMVVVILGRELLVTSLRGVTEASGKAFGANLHGKAKMFLQSFTIVWILVTVAHPYGSSILVQARPFVIYLMIAVTLLSGVSYVWAAKGVLSQTSVPTS